MGRTVGANGYSEREYRKDAEIANLKADRAALRKQVRELKQQQQKKN